MKRFTIPFVGLVVLCLIAVTFQNCGGGAKGSSSIVASSTPLPTPAPAPDPNSWSKGESFDYSKLPDVMKSQMVQTQLTSLGYASATSAKAVAITSDGLGFVKVGNNGVTQDQVSKIAQDACYSIAGGKPCSLIATGNIWNVNRNDLNNSFTHVLPFPSTISATSIPFLNPSDASSVATTYNAAASPKALAISLDGAYFFIASTANEPVADVAEASRLVLERCELGGGYVPCVLFAQDNSIVFNPSNINRSLAIDYARATLGTNIPGIRQALYVSLFQNDYNTKVNGTSLFGSIYITADGVGGYAYNASAATANTTALNGCNNVAIPAFPCFKYAVNKTIQPLAANLVAVKTFGTALHCKAVPRSSCAAHIAVGCPTGNQYYTANGAGTVILQTCL